MCHFDVPIRWNVKQRLLSMSDPSESVSAPDLPTSEDFSTTETEVTDQDTKPSLRSLMRESNAIAEGRIGHTNGRPRYLTDAEEDELVETISHWSNPLTHPTVPDLAPIVCKLYSRTVSLCFPFAVSVLRLFRHLRSNRSGRGPVRRN
jgi:hypothetical protein